MSVNTLPHYNYVTSLRVAKPRLLLQDAMYMEYKWKEKSLRSSSSMHGDNEYEQISGSGIK